VAFAIGPNVPQVPHPRFDRQEKQEKWQIIHFMNSSLEIRSLKVHESEKD
jgi:hypothetical protein